MINSPPQLSASTGKATMVLQFLLPVLGALGGSLFFLIYFVNGSRQPLMLVIALAVPLLSIVTALATGLIQRRVAKDTAGQCAVGIPEVP